MVSFAYPKPGQICNKVGTVMQSIADFPVKKGLYAIGHVRYSTSGGLDFCQPVYAKTNLGEIAVAHNGNLTNAEKLRQTLMQKGRLFKQKDSRPSADIKKRPSNVFASDKMSFDLSQEE